MKFFFKLIPTLMLLFLMQFVNSQNYSWQKLDTEKYKGKQDDIYFINKNEGWYVNGSGKIYHTTNAGINWEKQIDKKGTFFRCIAFINKNIGFAGTVGTDYFPNVTDTIPLYKTLDGGKNWEAVKYEGKYVKGLCAIDIVKEKYINHGQADYKLHIFAVGRVGSPANMMVSHDNGETFQSYDMSKYCQMLFDIKMLNKNEGFACAASSSNLDETYAQILHTKNGGKSWKIVYQSKRKSETSWKICFPSEKIGFATLQSYNLDTNVNEQHIIKTTNGGKKWEELLLCKDFDARPFGIGFIDEKNGFVGTSNNGYETNDGGKTWHKIDLGKACNKIRIQKDESNQIYGYAIGVSVLKLISNQ
jgi:photosystem II stability/assembly factor-like uncharacterized protein